MKVLCIGHITYDITFPMDTFPKENTKTHYHTQEQCTGGPASIAAFLLAKWNIDTFIAGVVGSDEYGRKIQKEFSINRVNTEYLSLNEKVETSHSLILANRSNGQRTIFTYAPKHVELKPFKIEKPDVILVDGYEFETSKKLISMHPEAISVLDAGSNKKEIVELGKMVNYLVCSQDFAESVSGIKMDFNNKKTLMDVYTKLEIIFKNNIVITLGSNGSMYKFNGQIKIMPSVKVKTVDSTAAGDIFHGAFVYGLLQKFDYEKIIKFSNIAGALSVTRVGGYRSIPSLDEMNEVYEQVK